MCVIVRKPKGIEVAENVLRSCWQHNPNGAGFMYVENGKIVVVKGLMKLKYFLQVYQEHQPKDKEVVIHFRLATHGQINPEQTHPFIVANRLGMVHNGMIDFRDSDENCYTRVPYKVKKEEDESDTIQFCKRILDKLPGNFEDNEGIVDLLNQYLISENSTVLLLDKSGNILKLGYDGDAEELDGCWFSNTFWDKKYRSVEFKTNDGWTGYESEHFGEFDNYDRRERLEAHENS